MQNNTSRTSPHVRRKREKRRTRAVNKTNPNAVSATETTVSNDVLAVRKFHDRIAKARYDSLKTKEGRRPARTSTAIDRRPVFDARSSSLRMQTITERSSALRTLPRTAPLSAPREHGRASG